MHNMNYKGMQNTEKIQRDKMIRHNLKANGISLTISSNLLYFNFTKSRQKTLYEVTLENLRHNVSDLRRNNVSIALANYVTKQLKSIYLYPNVLVIGFYQTLLNEITELVSITSLALDLCQAITY